MQDRQPFLKEEALRADLRRYLGGILNNLGCSSIMIGGIEDHVHILSTMARACDPASMIKESKRGSSIWLKTKSPELKSFAWQSSYGIFSVSYSQVESVKTYIAKQKEHHIKMSFQDEFREMLKRHALAFDERYIWD